MTPTYKLCPHLLKAKNPEFYKAHSFGIVDMYADAEYLVKQVDEKEITHWEHQANSFILRDKDAPATKKDFRTKILLHKTPEVMKHRGSAEALVGPKCSQKLKNTAALILMSYKRSLRQNQGISLARIIWNAIAGKNIILDLRENTYTTEDFIQFIALSRADQNPIIYQLSRDPDIEDYMQGERLELIKGKLVPMDKPKDKKKKKDKKDEKQEKIVDKKDEKK